VRTWYVKEPVTEKGLERKFERIYIRLCKQQTCAQTNHRKQEKSKCLGPPLHHYSITLLMFDNPYLVCDVPEYIVRRLSLWKGRLTDS
jgi:hypothetical protein